MGSNNRVRDLLIVDDDPAQVYLFRYLLEQIGCEHNCHSARNGREALHFLRREGNWSGAPRPALIVLDLNMPGMNGCEVLMAIKADPDFRSIPVIIFSSGIREEDVARCYAERANAYVQKPRDYDESLRVVERIERFWLETATLTAPGAKSMGLG